MTPVMGAQLSLPAINVPTVAKVTLAGLDSPISELLGSVILGGQLLLNANTSWGELPSLANPAGNPNPGAWGPSAFGTLDANGDFVAYPGADGLMFALANQPSVNPAFTGLYNGLGVGVLPQIIDDALPIIRQLGINGSDYLNNTVAALSAAGIALSEGVWNAAGALLTLDIPGALADLVDGISAAGTLALGAGIYVLSNVVARAQAVFQVLSGSLGTLVQATVAQIGLVVARTVQVVTDTFAATSFEGGWNAAIDGIFGATGVPGTILNVTVGAGQFAYPNTAEQAFVPSVRTVVRGAVVEIADALTTTAPTAASSAAEAPAAPAASAASARAAAVEAAPAAEAPAADSSEAAPAAEAAEAPAAEVAAPKPARKAARAVRASA
jgi:hypothetical protein